MTHENETIIKTEQLTKQFGPVVAVDHLELEIKKGEIFGLVGPDGAGKTTTLRMLAAIMDPTAGSARIAGYDLRQEPERIKEHIGYMAQQFALYGDLTVLENINFFGDVFGVKGKARQERTERLLNFARLTEFTNRPAGRLSGGMKKKLGLACALIHSPAVLYLDEPTTGVDPVSRREFWDILADLHVEGTTILVSTPYMDEAERSARVGLMYGGRLIEVGTPNQIKALLPGELVEFRPESERFHGVGLLRQANRILTQQAGVLEVQTYGDLLHVFVDSVSQRRPQLEAALAAEQITLTNFRQTVPRMEEAFISLIGKMEEA
ncbi:MAG: ABC transporter ATP-binding protein [Anaerolineae bacterium]|nr:ABC transporter ATP-binding protein [Anaerolineae bacterium]MCQ3972989.1 ABC transporter ATP-binding protein [Anaerolineae bacterium]